MGNRTVVVLYNDLAYEWENDPLLGKKIADGMGDVFIGSRHGQRADLGYGRVVECTHADNVTLALVEGYHYSPIVHGFWRTGQKYEDAKMDLLRGWADKMGYRLVKKSEEKK